MTCGCEDKDHESPPLLDQLRAVVAAELSERINPGLAELVELYRRPSPVRVVPSDVLNVTSHRVSAGDVFKIPHSLDRLRLTITAYASDAGGGGVIEAFVGSPDATLAPDGVSGLGHPLLFAESSGGPVATVTFATRAEMEVRVIRCTGSGLVTVTHELADAT